jgi:parvulin-like peptidyl-prolyl isomerase
MWRNLFFFPYFVLLLVNCESNGPAQRSPSGLDTQEAKQNYIILRVQESFYFNSDLERYLRLGLGNDYEELSDISLSRLVDNFVEEKIFLEAARNQEMSLTLEEKKEYLARYINQPAAEENKSPMGEEEINLLFDQFLVEKYTYALVKETKVEEEEIEEYYLEHKREFLLPERVKVSQILLPSEDKAVKILERVKNAGLEDFRRTARTESIGVEAPKGGEMGVFEMGQLPPEMESVIFSLHEGEVSPVLESSYGFHIFRLDARFEPELTREEEARASIETKILSQKIKDQIYRKIQELKDSLEWNFYPQNLYFSYQRIQDE